MTQTKFWTASIAAGVVLTLLVAAAHFASNDKGRASDRNARLARLQVLLDEGKTEYRASLFKKKIKSTVERIAGLDDSAAVTVIQPAKAKEAKDEKKLAKKDEKKKDDKSKKKKKKNKKKKKIKGAGEKEESAPEDSSDEEETDSSDEIAASGAAGNNSPAQGGAGVNTNPQTIEEWYLYLQANLDYEHVSKFIQLAQAGEISADVFYGTIEKMLGDSNTRMHQFAVLALGSTPSQTSFTLLADVSKETTMASKVRAQASNYMQTYVRLEYVGYLSGVIASETEVNAAVTALRYVEQAAGKHLAGAQNSNSGSAAPGSQPTVEAPTTTRTPASSVTKTFETIAQSLAKASTSSNTQLRSMSAQTLQILRSLLGQQA